MVNIISGCATDKGTVREKNQDRIVCYTTKTSFGMLAAACICDGIGSFEFGEIAAEMVTEGITLWFRSVEDKRLYVSSEEDLVEDFDGTLRELNELVWERRKREGIKLGCTMSALLVINCNYYIFHVGDSRIYFVGDSLSQLTRDEVTYSETDGVIKRKLANCIGRSKELWVSCMSGKILVGNAFILGSDGLFKKLKETDIYEKITGLSSDRQVQKQCEEFIETVKSLGEKDNISCAIIRLK